MNALKENLVDKLRKLQADLATENRAADVLLIDLAISAFGHDDASALATESGGVGTIQKAVCEAFHVRYNELISPRRSKALVNARHLAIGLARLLTHESMPDLAIAFGKRDHTSILHAIRKTQPLIDLVASTVPEGSSIAAYVSAAQKIAAEKIIIRLVPSVSDAQSRYAGPSNASR